jgi:hypothetical protein
MFGWTLQATLSNQSGSGSASDRTATAATAAPPIAYQTCQGGRVGGGGGLYRLAKQRRDIT